MQAKGKQPLSGPDGPSHTVNEARSQGNRTDGAKDAHEGSQLGEEAVCYFFGEKRKVSRGVALWRDGREWEAGQHIHVGGKDI